MNISTFNEWLAAFRIHDIPKTVSLLTDNVKIKAYISYNLLKEYLVLLLENDLLEYIEGERDFKTTAKGMRFLHTYNQMSEMTMMTNTAPKKLASKFLF
jgi:predicted transcriptional regulator